MIKFMFIGAPRSGTAWAANWATTGPRLCIHDPLWDMHYEDLDTMRTGATELGIACTGLAFWPKWINQHPAKKVILHRDEAQVRAACKAIGYADVPPQLFRNLKEIGGKHVHWRELFENPRPIHEYLFEEPFDEERHLFLRTMSVTSKFRDRHQNPDVWKRLQKEVHAALSTPARIASPHDPVHKDSA